MIFEGEWEPPTEALDSVRVANTIETVLESHGITVTVETAESPVVIRGPIVVSGGDA